MIRLTVVTLIGGLIGSLLLLVSSNKAFSVVVPFLLMPASQSRAVTPYGAVGPLLVSIYGGYFNGGLGIVLLALFALWGWPISTR